MTEDFPCVLIWFRRDLRLSDNRAVALALKHSLPVIALYVWDDVTEGDCARVWLHETLRDLNNQLEAKGTRLIVQRGSPEEVIQQLVSEFSIKAVYWNCSYVKDEQEQEESIRRDLAKREIDVVCSHSCLLENPDHFLNKQGTPYKVFTPYYRKRRESLSISLVDCSADWIPMPEYPESESIEDLDLVEAWGDAIISSWDATRAGAERGLEAFINNTLEDYEGSRDFPASSGTSKLSPYLHFGQLSPKEVLFAVEKSNQADKVKEVFIRQVIWREFSYYILQHNPELNICSLDRDFDSYPWHENPDTLNVWRRGLTGYPLIDAAMRQLWQTGWMHNRLRMLVGSFLVKDLMQDWRHGYRWFMETLLDADIACNGFGWQWVAGCGCDAAPYFRVFNPHLQSKKYDPSGEFICKYVPELKALSDKWIHCPSKAPQKVLEDAGVTLGRTYPYEIVDHKEAREEALKGYYLLKKKA